MSKNRNHVPAIVVCTLSAVLSPSAIADTFDGPVSAKIVAFNASAARADLAIADAFIAGGFASADIFSTGVVDGVPTGEFVISITELDATTRQIDVSWIFPSAIIAPATTFLAEPFTQLAFEFGAPNPVLDPLLADSAAVVEVLSQSGTLTDANGNTFNTGGFIFLGKDNAGLVGYSAFILPDEFGNPQDISSAGWDGFSASAVYRVVPSPASACLLALAGLAAARRRR